MFEEMSKKLAKPLLKFASIISDVSTTTIVITSLIGSGSGVLHYFTGFFTNQICFPVWGLIAIVFTVCAASAMIRFLRERRNHKQLFRVGDRVVINGGGASYTVIGYHPWKLTKVICIKSSEPEKRLCFDESIFTLYQGARIRYGAYNRNKARSL